MYDQKLFLGAVMVGTLLLAGACSSDKANPTLPSVASGDQAPRTMVITGEQPRLPVITAGEQAVLPSVISSGDPAELPVIIPDDPTIPLPPTGLSAPEVKISRNGFLLVWSPNQEADVFGYQVYIFQPSPDRLESYVPINARAPFTSHSFACQWDMSSPVWVRISAVDLSGNESALSAPYCVTWQRQIFSGDNSSPPDSGPRGSGGSLPPEGGAHDSQSAQY